MSALQHPRETQIKQACVCNICARTRARRSLFYLLSNNHVNDMIMFDFRLEDEEVLSHFASFLKTLSLRLNENTVQVNRWMDRSIDLPINSSRPIVLVGAHVAIALRST